MTKDTDEFGFTIHKNEKTEVDELEKTYAQVLMLGAETLVGTTELTKRNLIPFSIIEKDAYFQGIPKQVKKNRRFLKRKQSKEMLDLIDKVCTAIGSFLAYKREKELNKNEY